MKNHKSLGLSLFLMAAGFCLLFLVSPSKAHATDKCDVTAKLMVLDLPGGPIKYYQCKKQGLYRCQLNTSDCQNQ